MQKHHEQISWTTEGTSAICTGRLAQDQKSRAEARVIRWLKKESVNLTPSTRSFLRANWIIPKNGLLGLKALIGFFGVVGEQEDKDKSEQAV